MAISPISTHADSLRRDPRIAGAKRLIAEAVAEKHGAQLHEVGPGLVVKSAV